MSQPKVWVTGAAGLIGSEIVRQGARLASGAEIVPLTRKELDLADFAAVARRFEVDQPLLTIHCAALSRNPACEADPTLARLLNVEVTRHLAKLCAGRTLLFFSSDLVFDGKKGWYVESDPVGPLSVYSKTKVDAEPCVLEFPGHLVLRASLNYGQSASGDRAFNEEMVRTALAGDRLKLFVDEFRCPLAAEVTARAVWELVRPILSGSDGPRPAGIFHLGGSERLSRWQIGNLVAEAHPELRGHLEASSRHDYAGPPRPADTSLVCTRIEPWLETPLPAFTDWIRQSIPVSS